MAERHAFLAIAAVQEEKHLGIPVVATKRPAMVENNGLEPTHPKFSARELPNLNDRLRLPDLWLGFAPKFGSGLQPNPEVHSIFAVFSERPQIRQFGDLIFQFSTEVTGYRYPLQQIDVTILFAPILEHMKQNQRPNLSTSA